MKRFTRTLIVCVVMTALLVTPIFAQGQKDSAEPEAKKVIAGVVFQEDQFFKTVSAGYQAAAKDYGYEILLANTTMDQSKENDIVNTYLAQGVAGIAIAPMSNDISPATLGDVAEAGMKMVVCNINYDSFPFAAAAYTADNYSFCHQTGEAAATYFKDNNLGSSTPLKAGIIQFKTQFPEQANARVTGFFDALEEAGIKYEIVADQDAWLQDMAVAKCGDMLAAQPDIDFVFAANDGGTVGSTMAVENAGLEGHTVVFGTDGSEQIVSLLKDDANILQAVTGQDAFNIGYSSVEALIKYIEGEDFEGMGQTNIIAGTPLVRGDTEGLQKFLDDMKSRM